MPIRRFIERLVVLFYQAVSGAVNYLTQTDLFTNIIIDKSFICKDIYRLVILSPSLRSRVNSTKLSEESGQRKYGFSFAKAGCFAFRLSMTIKTVSLNT